ncbi:Zn(2)-C6 fungal-type domain-containing protein [Mycena venus]|uniref:Zn(2)-C6 fungal-type domain-containing protein n=1 Tax=Mycena venus TaxID=2733690 RepID=A0A8H6YZV2_9AGAR|nr:Zn(2)-C6 fungal-type domain-containing protein [Mycena venus]
MTSLQFQLLSDQEIIDMKRSRGIMACAECQRRKLKCDKKFPCTSCVRRGRGDICPTGDMGPIGRGRRLTRKESREWGPEIQGTKDCIHRLNSVGAGRSEPTHASLRNVTRTPNLPRSPSISPPAQWAATFTTLGSNTCCSPRSFKRPSVQPSACCDPYTSDQLDSFESTHECDYLPPSAPLQLDILLRQLPDELGAWALYDLYVADAAPWYGKAITPEELHELLAYIYHPHAGTDICDISSHGLAVVFLAFALALSLPPYSQIHSQAWAHAYFKLGRAALALESTCDYVGSTETNQHTIQALVLAEMYYATWGLRCSVKSPGALDKALSSAHQLELADDVGCNVFDRSQAFVEHSSTSSSPSPPAGGLIVPSLIPGLMSPPSTPESSYTSSFPLEAFSPGRASMSTPVDGDALEAYLVAQMQMMPVSEMEWMGFVSLHQ